MQHPSTELSYEQSFLQSDFDLTKLTEFNPALVYGFEAEPSLMESKRDEGSAEHLLHLAGQYQDMYNAYMYAQEVIIPEIKQTGFNNLTADRVIFWLDEIHKRIAATLAKDVLDAGLKGGSVAGACSQRIVLRWHNGSKISDLLAMYLSGFAPADTNIVKTLMGQGIEAATANKFMQILQKVVKDASIKVPETELQFMDKSNPYLKGNLVKCKLAIAYHSKKFNAEELECIDKVVKICALPSDLQALRRKFVDDFLAQLQTTDPNNKGSVAKLAFNTFYGVTERHWWFNANGRAATCFLNIVLRLLEKPSILVRNPSEKGSPTSSYSRAISMIDKEPQQLEKHLANRIDETSSGKFYTNPTEAEHMVLRANLAKMVVRVKLEFPKYNLNVFLKSKHLAISTQAHQIQQTHEKKISFVLQGLLKSVGELHAKLTELAGKSIISHLAQTAPDKSEPGDTSQAQFRP